MLLKHIFSDINISNLLTHVKKYFYYNHFLYIEETIQKFLACSIDIMMIVTWIGVWIPAYNISKISPVEALKDE